MRLKTYLGIMEEIGWPNMYLISPTQFEHVEGDKLRGLCGCASDTQPVFAINSGMWAKSLKNLKSTIYHEIAHLLWPWRKHWWIDLYGEIMAKGGQRGEWAKKYNKTPEDMPDRDTLLRFTRKAVKKFNENVV